MGLTDNQKRLIQAVSLNDIQAAKKCAIACVAEDATAKNKYFCTKYKAVLESTGCNMMELLQNLKGLLVLEDTSISFREGRYYLSDREAAVFRGITRMRKVNARLMELGIPYVNSTLLYGESGTGKTTFGRYVAYKAELPYCYMNFSGLVDSYMGSTSKNISKAFSYAISNPCVLMLDEIDCISIARSGSGDSSGSGGEMARITISLMQEFDRLPNDVIVIGATNRIDRVDDALLRRFSVKHEVKALSQEEKTAMVKRFLSDVGISFPDEEIATLVAQGNQSLVLNGLIRHIAERISEEIA
ncbi:MAG: ATP-binding protein [Alphaproteobacteria bacterium]|nr:ATP-binding protein [Alphaproteobacteria bacterium]